MGLNTKKSLINQPKKAHSLPFTHPTVQIINWDDKKKMKEGNAGMNPRKSDELGGFLGFGR